MALRRFVPLAALGLLFAALCPAARADTFTVTYYDNIPATSTNWFLPLTFPKFDIPGGFLTGVDASGQADMVGQVTLTNTSATLSGNGGGSFTTHFFSNFNATDTGTYSTTLGPLGSTQMTVTDSQTGNFSDTTPADLALFVATGPGQTIGLPVSAQGSFLKSGDSWVTITENSLTGAVEGQLTYTYYTPEPGTLALMGLALPGLGFMLRRKRKGSLS
jgi:hypothetical protein